MTAGLEALAVKPTENLQAYDLYLPGKRYARRQTRQDLEFALQMFENAVTRDASFALADAACANVCTMFYCNFSRDLTWVERAREAPGKAVALRWDLPEVQVSQAWVLYASGLHDEAVRMVKRPSNVNATARVRITCCAAPCLPRDATRKSWRFRKLLPRRAVRTITLSCQALGAQGNDDGQRKMARRAVEDARARVLLGADFAILGRVEDAL